jgi:putative ABC transport system permease protein
MRCLKRDSPLREPRPEFWDRSRAVYQRASSTALTGRSACGSIPPSYLRSSVPSNAGAAAMARSINGIVGHVRQGSLDQPPAPMMYVPTAQVNDGVVALNNRIGAVQWVVRTRLQPFSLSADIQRELREATGGLPVTHIRSMQQVIGESTARNDFNMTLLTIFAGVALLLAAIGVYGLMGYSVQQRTQEIGAHMALGASPHQVLRTVVIQGMKSRS